MRRDFDRWMQECGRAPAPANTGVVVTVGCTRAEVLAALATVQGRVFGLERRGPSGERCAAVTASLDDLGSLQGQRSADLAGTGGRQRKAVARTFVGTTTADAAHHDPSAPAAVQGLRAEVKGNNVLLYWASPAQHDLPVDHYQVRKGRTWAGGSEVGSNGNATFGFVFEQDAGLHQYWVAAVNRAGRVGPAAGILVYAGPVGE